MEQVLIDKATVPANAKEAFMKRMNMSRDFLKKQPGLIREEAYESTDANGNLTVMTTVVWQNEETFKKAREAVMTEYKREGFDLQAFCQRLNIKIERGIYHNMGN